MKIRVGRKVVGEVVGTHFIKKVKGSKHFLKVPPAIAFDVQSLRQAYNVGAKDVAVTDTETGDAYTTTLVNIFANGFEIDRGYGKQLALSIDKWTKTV